MTLKKHLQNEQGYMLLESLVALSILSLLMLSIYPLVVDWLVNVKVEKEKVEMSRVLYESSHIWPDALKDSPYAIKKTKNSLVISDEKQTVEVHIYETAIKK